MNKALSGLGTLLIAASLVSCGGGDDGGSGAIGGNVAVTQLPNTDQEKATLSGDWQFDDPATTTFIVRSQDEWNEVWRRRGANGLCDLYGLTWNRFFCASEGPPPVDFTRYSLVGILLRDVYLFDDPAPRYVNQDEGGPLHVEYRYTHVDRVPGVLSVQNRFFLVPRTSAALEVRAKDCGSSC